jgi:ABC-2 type transport system ATP-binding protein
MKIGEQALYLAQLKGLPKDKAMRLVKEWFVKLEMESWWNKKVEDLSKGMQQKLQFVTTVLHQPKLIILDEPFSGLDPVNSNIIKEEIYKLAKQGSTVIFSTHRMEQVEEICDQIVLVNRGKKILDGTVKSVKQQFKQNLFRIGFEGTPPAGDSSAFEITRHTDDESLIVRIREGHAPNDVLNHFLRQNASIVSFNELLPTLNEIFIELVEGTPTARQFQKVTA